ncbi:hypothetical protein DFH08DRAFT_843696 [Mycena albidolilacea]|uniref:Uncharacterized protein n=1 Tax=Mycena albidolilacea TaxID=1033008 RepID=A0AAD7F1A8_9AGAR|nr:hypothetical protein DFH08DRAFT_843696 [Mycena albidolilacea]
MLARVIRDVEESGRAEERAREWQRAIETERARAEREVGEREREMEMEKEKEKERAEREREAELEREYEEKMQSLKAAKGKAKAQSLNSPPASPKGAARPKGRLHRSKSLLMALVACVFFYRSLSLSQCSRSLDTRPRFFCGTLHSRLQAPPLRRHRLRAHPQHLHPHQRLGPLFPRHRVPPRHFVYSRAAHLFLPFHLLQKQTLLRRLRIPHRHPRAHARDPVPLQLPPRAIPTPSRTLRHHQARPRRPRLRLRSPHSSSARAHGTRR